MQKNDRIRMTALRLGADMEGICSHEGLTVFVPGLLPGEEALVHIVKVEKRYAFGRVEQLLPPLSPERRDPGCAHYPRCGGCSGLHMTYAATLRAKGQQVADCFARIGGMEVSPLPTLGMEDPFHYRNKISLPVGGTAAEPLIGYYAPRSHVIIPAADCPNARIPAGKIAEAVRSWITALRIPPYREEEGRGTLRHIVIRVSRTGESMVTLVSQASQLPGIEALRDALQPLGVVSLWLNINRQRNNVILGDRFIRLWGTETLEDSILGLRFRLSPASFFQVNPEQTDRLYETALRYADPQAGDTVCDLYSGAGTITLNLARRCRHAVGIEIVPAAIENAKQNALLNGVSNVSFHAGRAEELLPRMIADGLRPDILVADPPRKGMEPSVIQAIAQAAPRKVVYVSCNPATLARDARLLADAGYAVERVQPVDMFCWTSGIETVVLMSQQKPDDTIHVGIDLKPEDVTVAESKATYAELQAYIEE